MKIMNSLGLESLHMWTGLDVDTEDVGGHGRSPYEIPGPRSFVPLTSEGPVCLQPCNASRVRISISKLIYFTLNCVEVSKE